MKRQRAINVLLHNSRAEFKPHPMPEYTHKAQFAATGIAVPQVLGAEASAKLHADASNTGT